MGALGLLYGSYIADHAGNDTVSFIVSDARKQRYRDKIFTENGKVVDFAVESEELATPADLVIVAVKYNDLKSALDTMRNCVGSHTVIMSVMNGISSEKIIAGRYGKSNIVYTVAQGMDAVKIGDDLTFSQMGKLHIGMPAGSDDAPLREVISYFDRIGMPYVVEKDIVLRMWSKFMLNVGINQTCMAFETDYAGCLAPGEAHDVMIDAMQEVRAVAAAEGVNIAEEEVEKYLDIVRTLRPDSIPSMRQDSLQKKKTEVDMFAGTVMELAEKHNIAVPANEFLFYRAKQIEAAY